MMMMEVDVEINGIRARVRVRVQSFNKVLRTKITLRKV